MYIESTGGDQFAIQDLTSEELKVIQQSIIYFKETVNNEFGLLPNDRVFIDKLSAAIKVEVLNSISK